MIDDAPPATYDRVADRASTRTSGEGRFDATPPPPRRGKRAAAAKKPAKRTPPPETPPEDEEDYFQVD
jgi:hypothetical protein